MNVTTFQNQLLSLATGNLIACSNFKIGDDEKALLDGVLKLEDVLNPDGTPQTDTQIQIVPVGEAGCLLWNNLPLEIAKLVASPVLSAIMLLSPDISSESEFADQLWQHLVEINPQQVQVRQAITFDEPRLKYPLLTPQESALPHWLTTHIEQLSYASLRSNVDAIALKAGLYQVHDALHRSHSFSQSIEGKGRHQAGDYWHAIMHRREPDYGNSKYWFRHVGQHPLFEELSQHATRVLDRTQHPVASSWKSKVCGNGWDADAFVDLAEHCANDDTTQLARAAREIQWIEMLLLLKHTCQDASET